MSEPVRLEPISLSEYVSEYGRFVLRSATNIWVILSTIINFGVAFLAVRETPYRTWFFVLLLLGVVATIVLILLNSYRINRTLYAAKRELESQLLALGNRRAEYRLEIIENLVSQFSQYEKAKRLAANLQRDARIVQLRRFYDSSTGAILNIGKEEGVEIGTPFKAYKIDTLTSEGGVIEEPLGIFVVTHVQTEGNVCQAALVDGSHAADFWDNVTARLDEAVSPQVPRNKVMPYVPPSLAQLSLETMQEIRELLSSILGTLRLET